LTNAVGIDELSVYVPRLFCLPQESFPLREVSILLS